jgi:copper chaperone CopZ
MTHTYQITGMTCANCEAKVKSALLTLPDVTSAEVSRETSTATITMTKHIALSELQKAIGESGKYKITAQRITAKQQSKQNLGSPLTNPFF